MTRKVRHPYQVLDASEMAVGQYYAFVHASENGGNLVSCYAMGGVFADSPATAQRLGHNLALADEPQVEMLVADSPSGPIVTIHMDGWRVKTRRTLLTGQNPRRWCTGGRESGWAAKPVGTCCQHT